MTDLQTAGEPEGSAASLAAAVLDEEAARQEAQARAKEQVIFPDDLLPGVNSEPVALQGRVRRGRQARCSSCSGCCVSFDELDANAVQTARARDPPDLPHQQRRGRVHRAPRRRPVLRARRGADGLARRPRASACRSSAVASARRRACSRSSSGLAGQRVHAVLDAASLTGIAKANNIPVHQSLIADNYPIGIRARMSAAMNIGAAGARQPRARCSSAAIADVGRRRRRLALGVVRARHPGARSSPLVAFFMKEPPRGQFEKDDVLGEVIEDEHPAPTSMEAAFARLKKIATIRTSIAAFCGARLRRCSASASLQSLYLERHAARARTARTAASSSASSGIAALPFLLSRRRATSTACTARTRPRRWRSSAR